MMKKELVEEAGATTLEIYIRQLDQMMQPEELRAVAGITDLPEQSIFLAGLPRPFADDAPEFAETYDLAWKLAHRNLRGVEGSALTFPYIDTMLNEHVFLWDSGFMALYDSYAGNGFRFSNTLLNFYLKQSCDGFIGREIHRTTGRNRYHRHDPVGTGPNVLAWLEWQLYSRGRNIDRLRVIFPALKAFHDWFGLNRRWPDGTYWSNGWACGMDNQLRAGSEAFDYSHHGFRSWVDATMQQAISAKFLAMIGREIGEDPTQLDAEFHELHQIINTRFWNAETGFYHDILPDGSLGEVMSIGAFWALIGGLADTAKQEALIAHLTNPETFGTEHPVASLAQLHDHFDPEGGYWRGGVWAPTNYMVFTGLRDVGQHALAHRLARAHLERVAKTAQDTGTIWENYAPLGAAQGKPAKPDFVGWSGLSAINMFIEFVLGIDIRGRADCDIYWTPFEMGAHGIDNLTLPDGRMINMQIAARKTPAQKPEVTLTGSSGISVIVGYDGKELHVTT